MAPRLLDVHRRTDPSPALVALAAAQAGVVTAAQAELLGLGRHARQRLLREGRWRRLDTAVYAVHPSRWSGSPWAGILLGGADARLARAAAAHLHGLADPPAEVDVLVRPDARPRSRTPWVFTREQPGVRSRGVLGEPPRTSVEDTVLDLCDGADPATVVDWVTRAVGGRLTTARRLGTALEGRRRFAGRRLMSELLGDVGTGVQSPLELRYLREVERPHGLPRGTRQHRSHARHLRDVVYEEYGVVVELDGRIGHEGMGRFRGMDRDNLASLSGELTLRYGTVDVAGSPCLVAEQVFGALALRGRRDPFGRCPSCASVHAV